MALAGQRLDRALSAVFPDFTRSRLQDWIKGGAAMVDGMVLPQAPDPGGERVVLRAEVESKAAVQGEAIPLAIVYEDASLLVVDKPPGWWCTPPQATGTGRYRTPCCTMPRSWRVFPGVDWCTGSIRTPAGY